MLVEKLKSPSGLSWSKPTPSGGQKPNGVNDIGSWNPNGPTGVNNATSESVMTPGTQPTLSTRRRVSFIGKGAFKNYVDHVLPYFDHLPTPGWHFYWKVETVKNETWTQNSWKFSFQIYPTILNAHKYTHHRYAFFMHKIENMKKLQFNRLSEL